ncbi:DNA polymerase III subunit beta [Peptacetobacter sp.]|uniref:DNA polymerase III subunit beta n=1 Tax=Peptacetobacter sp. TaxID=2991975 RepID=UPI002616EFAF|nr:DNA polymerase III subunit beta [Peptacetobacter sp.]
MKLICNQKILSQKISIVQKAINNRTTIELLKGILLSTENGNLKLIGSDAEIRIETFVQSEIEEDGKIVLDAKLFGDIIRKLPDSFVQIETDTNNNVHIYCENSRFTIKGHSAEDYPLISDIEENKMYSIPQELLKEMIKQTSFATSQDQSKPVLMGELLESANGTTSLVAIDGYRLAVRSCFIDGFNENIKVIIPGKTLIDINSLMQGEGDINIGFTDKNAIFMIDNTKIITRLLEGDFIDYNRLLPKEYNSRIKLKSKELLNSIERAALLSQSEKNNLIKLSIRDNLMIITSNTDRGNVYEEVSLELEGEYLDIAFNSRYLMEGLRYIDSEEIYIEFTTNVNPCIIKPVDEIDYTYLLLPVRISSNM